MHALRRMAVAAKCDDAANRLAPSLLLCENPCSSARALPGPSPGSLSLVPKFVRSKGPPMPSSPKKISAAVCAAVVLALFALGLARPAHSHVAPVFVPQQNAKQNAAKKPAKQSEVAAQSEGDDQDKSDKDDDENADDDPAAVTLDVSQDSPLIRELYQATRVTKEKDILAHLDAAKRLLASDRRAHV